MQFQSIVASLELNLDRPVERRLCPDQYVGLLEQLDANKEICMREAATARPPGHGLLVVLESPHVDEYRDTPVPANGRTGKKIARYIRQVVDANVEGDRQVVLVNAIQYQRSLGFPTERYRDRVFSTVWGSGGRESFIERMRSIYRPEDTVACCCTEENGLSRISGGRKGLLKTGTYA